ncbi:hypothetical protein [Providencia rettgeri]|uniref:hypothetical protein n=1 Tax=Providencia rettgeri TaxID=587 RepID=UPI00352457BD
MNTKSRIKQIKAMINKHNTADESFDTLVIMAIMDEINGDKPEGTSEEVERRFNRRTGYTFPASEELKQLFSQCPDSTKEQDDNIAAIIVKS